MVQREFIQLFLWTVLAVFILMNVVACFHAYKFTHFNNSLKPNCDEAPYASLMQKISALLFGVKNPRPVNAVAPGRPYETIRIKSNKEIVCWLIKADVPKGRLFYFMVLGMKNR